MSPAQILSDALLCLGVAIEIGCCIGVLVMRDAYDKLHYTGPGATLGALAIAASIVARESLAQGGIKALLCAGFLVVANPVLSHATGRALYIRQRDHLEPEAGTASEGRP